MLIQWLKNIAISFMDKEAKEINCKIVYYGPGLSGRTTNMQYIYETMTSQSKSKLTSIATEERRTLFFNFTPLDLRTLGGLKVRFHLYARPGAVFCNNDLIQMLKGVDGIIFIADSQVERIDANIESLWNLENNLKVHGYDLMNIPYVLQLNKRDLPNILTVNELKKELMRKNEPVFEAVAYKGVGVFDTLKAVAKQILQKIENSNIQ